MLYGGKIVKGLVWPVEIILNKPPCSVLSRVQVHSPSIKQNIVLFNLAKPDRVNPRKAEKK
jgi:hypothetical protein